MASPASTEARAALLAISAANDCISSTRCPKEEMIAGVEVAASCVNSISPH